MADTGACEEIRCGNCFNIYVKMKRCTRCNSVYYCSRECQMKDWTNHKMTCGQQFHSTQNKDIFTDQSESSTSDCHSEKANIHSRSPGDKGSYSDTKFTSIVNFEKAVKDLNDKSKRDILSCEESCEKHGKFYYHKTEACYDVPAFKSDLPYEQISVKCDKLKNKLDINYHWTGDEIYKYLSCELEIPLEKLKIIHKGTFVTNESICNSIAPKTVFQVIGEKSANEEGLDKKDIEVMMKQLGIKRNYAVKSLRQSGNLVDAIIAAGNK